jgi:beta-glucosidase
LLFPALRWDERDGFGHEAAAIEEALALGVGGFIIFGGEAAAVRELIAGLRSRSTIPLLIGADLERGAGQQFRGATPLPPVAGLGALADLEAIWRAGELTAREARALGVDWVYAPVADLDIEPRNPIVGSRAFGADPARVAEQVVAWVEGCRAGGALSCVKHFPGHGRTVSDSHLTLPEVEEGRHVLAADLLPFQGAIRAGVDGVMTAHVSYPALDPGGGPATLSPRIVTGLLREELGFDGLVVTDAMIMEGMLEAGSGEADAAVRAVAAGCDVLLYPRDPEAVAAALEAAVGVALPAHRAAEAVGWVAAAVGWVERLARGAGEAGGESGKAGARGVPGEVVTGGSTRAEQASEETGATAQPGVEVGWGRGEDMRWAEEIAVRVLRVARGRPALAPGRTIDLVTIDDDLGGPYPPPSREAFAAELRGGGMVVRESEFPLSSSADNSLVVALYADIRGWKGRPGLSGRAVELLDRIVEVHRGAVVVLFGHQRLAEQVPGPAAVLAAWGGEELMQRAAARWLVETR